MLSSTSYVHLGVLAIAIALAAAVIWAIILTIQDQSLGRATKAVWAFVLVFAPVIGLALWAIVRKRRRLLT